MIAEDLTVAPGRPAASQETIRIDAAATGQRSAAAAVLRPLANDRRVIERAPGFIERLLVGVAVFVFYHQTPNVWFIRHEDLTLDYSNSFAALATLGLILVAFARVAGRINLLIQLLRLEPAVFMFAGLALISMFWSADQSESMRRGIVFFAVTIFAGYLILRFALSEIIFILAAMFTVSAAINVFFVSAYPYYGIDEENLWTGVFSQKNALGYVAALAIPTLLVAARIRPRARLIFYIAVAAQGLLLIRSDSKTMLVAVALPTLLMVIYNGFRARHTLPGAVVIGLVGGSAFSVAFGTANIGVLAGWLDKDVTLTGRLPLWEALLPVIGERPWLGHGYSAAFGGFFSPVHDVWIYNQWAGDSHNAFIQILLDLGLVGLILFLVSYLRALARATAIVAIVPGSVGLWPLVILTQALLISVTESGIQSDSMGWTIYLVAVLSVAAHLAHRRTIGLSNELALAIHTNRARQAQPRIYPATGPDTSGNNGAGEWSQPAPAWERAGG
jgi:O-antigen ligase